jgi:hypothetical protein
MLSAAVAAVRVTVAVAVPEFDLATVNVVVPHPDAEGVASVPRAKFGRIMAIVSDVASSAFKENVKLIGEAAAVTGFDNTSLLNSKIGVATTADSEMLCAAMSSCPANVNATVRVFRLATCAVGLVVIPVAIVTVQCVSAGRVAVAAVSVRVAVAVPELDLVAANVVEPHPLVEGVANVASTKLGNTRAIASPDSKTTFSENKYETDEAADVTGVEKDNLL